MKKLLIALIAVVGLLGFIAAPLASAYDPVDNVCNGNTNGVNVNNSTLCSDQKNPNANPLTGPNGILHLAANITAILAGIVAVISIIVAGFRYITSGGDPSKVKGAKDALVAALVGVAIIALSQTIISFVLSKL